MQKFSYQAIDENGKTVSDSVEADSKDAVNNIILAKGLIPLKVTRHAAGGSNSALSFIKEKLSPVKVSELILFTKQLKTMIRAGVPMIRLLGILENQTENPTLKNIIDSISRDIKEGRSLFDAFKKHPKTFSPLYCSMLHAGETSGALPEVLERLIYILEHEHKVKSDIKAAMQYPVIVVVFLTMAFFILLTFVIPKFARIFKKAGIDIPVPTQICIFLYQFMTDYWYLLIGGIIVLGTVFYYYIKTKQGRYMVDSLLMKVPIIGQLLIKAAMSRFSSIFSILQSSGVATLDSIKILSGVINNTAITREFDKISERLEEGRGLAGPLESAKYFTPIVTNMVAIGEESGHLEEMLSEIADHYDVELEYEVKKLSDSIAPVLTIALAFIVGFFALAIFLPLWDLTKMAH